jgi:acyl transferase domain-containing protein
MGFLSPDSLCYSFDHRANGYARGEGFSFVVLKRVSDAVRDNDTIRAVIRSTGSNQDGHTPGITQPSRDSQERLIRETYEKAGLSMTPTRFFEAHGEDRREIESLHTI